jgi:hypothetical protein
MNKGVGREMFSKIIYYSKVLFLALSLVTLF